jgi:hypothetical protein
VHEQKAWRNDFCAPTATPAARDNYLNDPFRGCRMTDNMKILMTILLLSFCAFGQTQKPVLTADPGLAIPKLTFDTNGELQIAAAAGSSQNDFDFLVGKWKMFHRRLNKRLENCNDWTEFESLDEKSQNS